MKEADVIKSVQKWVRDKRIPYIRHVFRPGAVAGWPDFVYLLPGGKSLWIEYKAPGKKPTPTQQHKINVLKKLGHDVIVCDDPDEAVKALSARI